MDKQRRIERPLHLDGLAQSRLREARQRLGSGPKLLQDSPRQEKTLLPSFFARCCDALVDDRVMLGNCPTNDPGVRLHLFEEPRGTFHALADTPSLAPASEQGMA